MHSIAFQTAGSLPHLDQRYAYNWVYIGRSCRHFPHGSPLHNPYRRQPHQPRGSTLDAYRRHLCRQIRQGNPAVLRALHSLTPDTVLVCWCPQPGPCHGHVIRQAWRWLVGQTAGSQ